MSIKIVALSLLTPPVFSEIKQNKPTFTVGEDNSFYWLNSLDIVGIDINYNEEEKLLAIDNNKSNLAAKTTFNNLLTIVTNWMLVIIQPLCEKRNSLNFLLTKDAHSSELYSAWIEVVTETGKTIALKIFPRTVTETEILFCVSKFVDI